MRRFTAFLRRRGRDPRELQLLALMTLIIAGATSLGLDISWRNATAAFASALAAQLLAERWLVGRAFDPRSAAISAGSLTLLMRTSHPGWMALAAALAIGSKFTLRIGKRHLFNPTALAISLLTLLAPQAVWIDPGRWGRFAGLVLLVAVLGTWVTTRAATLDVTLAFLAAFGALLVSRAVWLGDPLKIPLHQASSSALLLFAFFMISDPKTTPRRRCDRVVFAVLVAALAYVLRFHLYRPTALLWSLTAAGVALPLIDGLGGRLRRVLSAAGQRKEKTHHDPTPLPAKARPLPLAGGPRARFRPARLLRLLRRPGRYQALQPRLESRHRARRRPHGAHHGQRL